LRGVPSSFSAMSGKPSDDLALRQPEISQKRIARSSQSEGVEAEDIARLLKKIKELAETKQVLERNLQGMKTTVQFLSSSLKSQKWERDEEPMEERLQGQVVSLEEAKEDAERNMESLLITVEYMRRQLQVDGPRQ
jgi:hypothetical protein